MDTLFSTKKAEIYTIEKKSIFNTLSWSTGYPHVKNSNNPYLSPCTILKCNWIKKTLNIKPDTLNLIEEKVEIILEYIGTGDNFLNGTLKAQDQHSVNRT